MEEDEERPAINVLLGALLSRMNISSDTFFFVNTLTLIQYAFPTGRPARP